MKRIIVLIFCCTLTVIQTRAQYIKDKDAFVKGFINVFTQREDGFDSLQKSQGENDFLKNPSEILSGANECYISSNGVFGALYKFSDSITASDFFKEIQGLIQQVAGRYKAQATFEHVNDDPSNLSFYFRDASGYTANFMNLSIEGTEPKSNSDDEDKDDTENTNTIEKAKGFEVLLLIHPGSSMWYFTSAGTKIADNNLNTFIQQVTFDADTTLSRIKSTKRQSRQNQTVYDSKLKPSGFSTTITEIVGKSSTGITVEAFRDYPSTSWEKFQLSVDSFLLKMKAAMPANFVYQINPDDNYIEFKPARFINFDENKMASIILSYEALNEKGNSYRLMLKIWRSYNDAAQKLKQSKQPGSFESVSNAYLNENKKKPGVLTTKSGLQYMVIKKGSGTRPGKNDECTFYSRGTLAGDIEFDNTYKTKSPVKGNLSMFIPGLSEGLQLMPVGSKYRFFIPPSLAYGNEQSGKIPPGSVIIYEIELLQVNKSQ